MDDTTPLRRDAIFRIASLGKPMAASAAMALVDDGILALDDPVERFLPELAKRRVLRRPDGPLNDTVPAARPMTLEDLLTLRLGFGAVMAPPGTLPIQKAEAALGLMTLGPPWPPPPFSTDEWLRRFATLPLMHQPGEGWRYNTGIQVLGVLLERVSGQGLEEFLRARLFAPLGMGDTGFWVGEDRIERLTTAYTPDPLTGALTLLDAPRGGWWNRPPAMPDVAGLLVATLDDVWAFVSMLLAGGVGLDRRVLSAASVAAMTRNHLTPAQRASASLFLGREGGWGYGMATPEPPRAEVPRPWGFGGDGGTGATWRNDPLRALTGTLLTQRAMTSPLPPPLFQAFWHGAYESIRP